MSFLRLGVACAVYDEAGRLLLSRRGDLDVWNLPTGRLDRGEALPDAAQREVYEETGIKAEITRVIGLYYYQGWQRMNILFEARQCGGRLQRKTFETHDNQFFMPADVPANNISQQMVEDLVNRAEIPMQVITMSADEYRRARLKLRWRWIKNLLHGHLEPPIHVLGCVHVVNPVMQIRIVLMWMVNVHYGSS